MNRYRRFCRQDKYYQHTRHDQSLYTLVLQRCRESWIVIDACADKMNIINTPEMIRAYTHCCCQFRFRCTFCSVLDARADKTTMINTPDTIRAYIHWCCKFDLVSGTKVSPACPGKFEMLRTCNIHSHTNTNAPNPHLSALESHRCGRARVLRTRRGTRGSHTAEISRLAFTTYEATTAPHACRA
jgi:hypothetical protein